jgi:adenosine deaminase
MWVLFAPLNSSVDYEYLVQANIYRANDKPLCELSLHSEALSVILTTYTRRTKTSVETGL